MTQAADIIRDKRRTFALPGGAHDRTIRFLARALPAGVGAVVAVMIVAPLFPRGEVSFLLDRNRVAVTQERVRVEQAMYRGQDNRGRAFSLTAGSALQRSASVPVVELRNLDARMQLADGPAELHAPEGSFHYDSNMVDVHGPVEFNSAGDYRLSTSNVSIDLKAQRVSGTGGVSGTVPSGTFSAGQIDADLANRTVTLSGRARFSMQPGKLRNPAR